MGKRLEVYEDNNKIVLKWIEDGKPHKFKEYLDMRAAVSWPNTKTESPYYYCIVGMRNRSLLSEDKHPYELRAEMEEANIETFFQSLIVHYKKLRCRYLFADLDNKNSKPFKDALYEFVRKRGVKGLNTLDSSSFYDTEYGIQLIRQGIDDGTLPEDKIGRNSILRNQLGKIEPEQAGLIDGGRFYAISALIRILISYEVYAWERPRRPKHKQLGNWQRMLAASNRDKRSSDYQEFYVPD